MRPGDEKYEVLRPDEKYEIAAEVLAEEKAKKKPDFSLIQKLTAEAHYQRIEATLQSPAWDLKNNFMLPDKGGRHVLFDPFPAQNRVIEAWLTAMMNDTPLRLLIPKSRRHGISQVVSALMYRHIRTLPNLMGLVVAHDDPATKEIFSKYRYYHKYDPYAPDLERGSVNEVKFLRTGSAIQVRTAGSSRQGVGHGFGFHAVHFSEPAFYQATDPYALISGILTAIPPISQAWTAVVMESTGNGQSGMFYDLCMEAWEEPEASDWELLFLPWNERYDAWRNFCTCRTERCSCSDGKKNLDRFMKSLDEEERLLQENYKLDPYQLHWRRHTYRNEIKAFSMSERRRKFRQEHPIDFMEVWQASGGSVFDADIIAKLMLKAKEPIWRGDIEARTGLFEGGQRVYKTPPPKIRTQRDGPLQVWEWPNREDTYTIGIDLAQGAIKGDFHVMSVFNRNTRQFVARYRIRGVSPMRMIEKARLLSRFYGNAILCPEVNFFPQFTEILADTDREKFMYWRKDPTRTSAAGEFVKAYGWRTTPNSKKNLVTMLQDKLETEPDIFTDKMLLREMLIFQEALTDSKDVKYPGAVGGDRSHDDIVIAAALALYCDNDMMPAQRRIREEYRSENWGKQPSVAERVTAAIEAAHSRDDDFQNDWDGYD